jgi:hypothetical protein
VQTIRAAVSDYYASIAKEARRIEDKFLPNPIVSYEPSHGTGLRLVSNNDRDFGYACNCIRNASAYQTRKRTSFSRAHNDHVGS